MQMDTKYDTLFILMVKTMVNCRVRVVAMVVNIDGQQLENKPYVLI